MAKNLDAWTCYADCLMLSFIKKKKKKKMKGNTIDQSCFFGPLFIFLSHMIIGFAKNAGMCFSHTEV